MYLKGFHILNFFKVTLKVNHIQKYLLQYFDETNFEQGWGLLLKCNKKWDSNKDKGPNFTLLQYVCFSKLWIEHNILWI